IYLPSGSILTGVLINGMDAPTSQGARRDPFPSTLRIQKEAILPNRFRADVRECFLIVSGYGDLSSERAYLRGETFSCVRDDGGVIEAKLDSYAVGEDGKAGVRGRVVSKQGQIIAKSLMAGFLGGVSEAFDVNPVPVVSTNPGSNTQYQSVFSDQMLQGAAVKGASKALDRIAQFYIDMAEGIFPVIEVDAGRQVDIIVTKGTKLQIRSTGGTKK
ncbi:conjugal transfer protein TraB, partial [Escherichia coli O157:H7]|nr:conjugal transfer protein TraB [Escherichia coli O157:H7]